MFKFLITYGDHASVGMYNREETVEARSEGAAYQVAKAHMRDGEFIRGVQRVEADA